MASAAKVTEILALIAAAGCLGMLFFSIFVSRRRAHSAAVSNRLFFKQNVADHVKQNAPPWMLDLIRSELLKTLETRKAVRRVFRDKKYDNATPSEASASDASLNETTV